MQGIDRLHGAGQLDVMRRLRQALEDLLGVAPPLWAGPLCVRLAHLDDATIRDFSERVHRVGRGPAGTRDG